jgi:cytochrome c
MRLTSLFATLFLAALTAACGKSATSEQPAAPAAPAAAPAPTVAPTPAAPSAADKKAILATLPAAYQSADLDNGEAKFALCKACHTVIAGGESGVGPNLHGVFGRKAGSVAGFNYSDGLKAAGFTWDVDHLDKWLTDPRGMIPTTKMTYIGVKDANDRRDVIAYLKVASSDTGKP